MAKTYAEGHKNSKEFDNMLIALTYVTNWGTKEALPTSISGAPKTYEEAVNQLKGIVEKYVKAKKDQRRLFPTRLRHLRFQLAKAMVVYANTQEKNIGDIAMSEEVADSWNKYFESKGETEILGEKPVETNGIGKKEMIEFDAIEVNDKNLGDKKIKKSV